MAWILDFVLLAASGAAAFYCYVLSRRLSDLLNTDKGIGASIASMSATVEQAREAVALARTSSAESVKALAPLLAEARETVPKLNELTDVISELADIAISDIENHAAGANEAVEARLAAFAHRADALEARLARIETDLAAQHALADLAGDLAPQTVYIDGEHAEPHSVDRALSRANRSRARMKGAA